MLKFLGNVTRGRLKLCVIIDPWSRFTRNTHTKRNPGYDVSNSEYGAKAFKLTVPEAESVIINDSASCPPYVKIRPWGSGSAKPISRAEKLASSATHSSLSEEMQASSDSVLPESVHNRNLPSSDSDSLDLVLNSTVIEVVKQNVTNTSTDEAVLLSGCQDNIDDDVTILTQQELSASGS